MRSDNVLASLTSFRNTYRPTPTGLCCRLCCWKRTLPLAGLMFLQSAGQPLPQLHVWLCQTQQRAAPSLNWCVMLLGLVLVLCSSNKVGLLLSGLGNLCLLSKLITSLSRSCLLSLKHWKPVEATLMAYPSTWSLTINLTHSLKPKLHCEAHRLAGVHTYNASTAHGNTDQAGSM